MDDLDRRLIGLLRDDGRMPIAKIAARLGVSRGTAQSRLDRLIERGEILGFTVRLKSDAVPGVRAITLIEEQTRDSRRTIRALRQIPEARAVYTANGRWDLMVEMAAASLAALDDALTLIRGIEGVLSTETIILLTPHKQ